MIHQLIDKFDTFELVRDKIAQILADETASQQALATAGGEDPDDWKFRIYLERSNAWEQWLNDVSDTTPIVNVSWDQSGFDESRSNTFASQKSESVYFIDILAVGKTELSGAGHIPGDRAASISAQKWCRLVRNIIMAGEYRYLGMQGIVTKRWPRALESFKVTAEKRTIRHIAGVRLSLNVEFIETVAFGDESNLLEYASVEIKRASDDSVLATVDYDYTTMPPYE